MPWAIGAVVDLAAIAGVLLVIGLITASAWVISNLLGVFNVNILGTHPFHDVITRAQNAVNSTAAGWVDANEFALQQLYQGLTWSAQQLGNGVADLAGATYSTFQHVVSTSIPDAVSASTDALSTVAHDAHTIALDLEGYIGLDGSNLVAIVNAGVTEAERYTDSAVAGLLGTAQGYATAAQRAAEQTAGTLVSQAVTSSAAAASRLQGEIDQVPDEIKQAVAGLAGGVTLADVRGAITTELQSGGSIAQAISGAVAAAAVGVSAGQVEDLIGQAVAAGGSISDAIERAVAAQAPSVSLSDVLSAISDALTPAGPIGAAISAAVAAIPEIPSPADLRAAAEQAISDAVAAGGTIDQVIAGVTSRLESEIAAIPVPDIATLTTAVAAVGATVATLEAEAGLDDPTCRGKVKGICGTDPAAWAQLLGGLVALGVGLDFGALVKLAEAGMSDSVDAVEALVG